MDQATGLMWTRDANLGRGDMSLGEAEKFIEELNRKVFAGYTDWRLPTIDELLTFSRNIRVYDFLNINLNKNRIYVSNHEEGNTIDIVDRQIFYFGPNRNHGYVWPVRSDK